MPIDGAKETQKERQPLFWYVFLLALGYSKPLCELSNALTALIRKEKIQQFLTPQATWNLVQVTDARATRDRATAARLQCCLKT